MKKKVKAAYPRLDDAKATRLIVDILQQISGLNEPEHAGKRQSLLQEAYAICQACPGVYPLRAAQVMEMIGAELLRQHTPEADRAAIVWLSQAIAVCCELGELAHPVLYSAAWKLANLQLAKGCCEDALSCFRVLLSLTEDAGSVAGILLQMAETCWKLNDGEQALQLLDEAAGIIRREADDNGIIVLSGSAANVNDLICELLCRRAEIYIARQQYDEVSDVVEQVIAIHHEGMCQSDYAFRAWRYLAIACCEQGMHQLAYECCAQAYMLDAGRQYGYFAAPRWAEYELALACWNTGLQDEARERLQVHLNAMGKDPFLHTVADEKAAPCDQFVEAAVLFRHSILVQHTLNQMDCSAGAVTVKFPLHADPASYWHDLQEMDDKEASGVLH